MIRDSIEVIRTKPPCKTSSSPMAEARAQNALKGRAKAQIAAARKTIPISTCAHRQPSRT